MATNNTLQKTADQIAPWESSEKLDLIKRTVAVGATNDELQLFFYQAKRTGLDPLSKQIYCIKRSGKMTIQVGIDGFRLVADRTGLYAGCDDIAYEGLIAGHPERAICTVYKIVAGLRCAFTATARWDEYYPGDQQGFQWRKMPHVMLGKCAEALALRKAFPADLSGLYTDVEMDQAGKADAIDAEVVEDPPKAARAAAPETAHTADKPTSGPTTTATGSTGSTSSEDPISNPRGKAFAALKRLGLPPHEGEAKGMYYVVFGKVLGHEFDTLRGITDDEWRKLLLWLERVESRVATMPPAFSTWLKEHPEPAPEVQEAVIIEEEPAQTAAQAPGGEEDPFAGEEDIDVDTVIAGLATWPERYEKLVNLSRAYGWPVWDDAEELCSVVWKAIVNLGRAKKLNAITRLDHVTLDDMGALLRYYIGYAQKKHPAPEAFLRWQAEQKKAAASQVLDERSA